MMIPLFVLPGRATFLVGMDGERFLYIEGEGTTIEIIRSARYLSTTYSNFPSFR